MLIFQYILCIIYYKHDMCVILYVIVYLLLYFIFY